MKKVIVTGATGMVAGYVIRAYLDRGDCMVYAVSGRKDMCRGLYPDQRLEVLSNEELLNSRMPEADLLIHCAFTRKNDAEQVAGAILLSEQVFAWALRERVRDVFYTSTRSIYREPEEGTLNTEDSPAVPAGLIGIGKYAVEQMMHLAFSQGGQGRYCILRLSSVNEIKRYEAMRRPINIFVENAIAGQPIKIKGGMQVMSYIDPTDIADAVMALDQCPPDSRQTVYNIGSGWKGTMKLLDIARRVQAIGTAEFGLPAVTIDVEDCFVDQHAGLDISRIQQDTGWAPRIGIDDMIRNIFRLYLSEDVKDI